MFKNYLRSALGDLWRSPIQSIIAIGGLAIGLTCTILMALVGIEAFTDDYFVKDYKRLHFAIISQHNSNGNKVYLNSTPHDLAGYLRNFPEIEKVARATGRAVILTRGDIKTRENINWADPDFFRIYQVEVLHGDLSTALDRPDGVVMTDDKALKYFGRVNAVGQTILLNHTYALTVRAIVKGWVPNSGNFNNRVYVSSLSQASVMTQDIGTQGMSPNGGLKTDMTTLVKVRPGASIDDLNRRATELVSRFVPKSMPYTRAMHFERVDLINMSPTVNPDNLGHLYILTTATLVILILSCVNFINLSVARSTQRGLEVAIRKATGATRWSLILQFMGEAILQVLLALLISIGLVEWTLPIVNTVLKSGVVFDYWQNPLLLPGMVVGGVLIGCLAGAYPALVLSSFRPAVVLKGWVKSAGKGEILRRIFVSLQFAAMVYFLIVAGVVFQQNNYLTTQAQRLPTGQTVLVRIGQCDDGLRTRIAALPGVTGVACSSNRVLMESTSGELAMPVKGGEAVGIYMVPIHPGFFELYGMKPLAGRFFRPGTGDAIPENAAPDRVVNYVANEAAIRRLGYASAAAAIGRPANFLSPSQIRATAPPKPGDPPVIHGLRGVIVGVVQDFSFTPQMTATMSYTGKIGPTVYALGNPEVNLPAPSDVMHVKLKGEAIPETLSAIDTAWAQSGQRDPINRQFLNDYIQQQELTTLRIGQIFATFAGIAMLLACLGLFGISLYTAARRTKEIGVRKAMGASTPDIVRLLLWQFARPVLWANAVALPLAWYGNHLWLSSFAYRTDLDWRIFAGAVLATLLVALLTVAAQSISAARAVPATALRYE